MNFTVAGEAFVETTLTLDFAASPGGIARNEAEIDRKSSAMSHPGLFHGVGANEGADNVITRINLQAREGERPRTTCERRVDQQQKMLAKASGNDDVLNASCVKSVRARNFSTVLKTTTL